MAKQYIGSFSKEIEKEKTLEEKERKRPFYEIQFPTLSKRQKAETLLTKVYLKNSALQSFLKKKKAIMTILPPLFWKNAKFFKVL